MRFIAIAILVLFSSCGCVSFAQEQSQPITIQGIEINEPNWHLKYLEMKGHALQMNKDRLIWEKLYHDERSQSIQGLFIPQVEKELEKVQKELEELKKPNVD